MKLQVTKNVFLGWLHPHYGVSDDGWMICLGCHVSSVILWFPYRVMKGIQKVTKTVLPSVLSSFLLPNGLEMSLYTGCNMYESLGSWKESKIHCVGWSWKNWFFSKEVSHGEIKHCQNNARVLIWVQDSLCKIVLKWPNFVEESLPWRFNAVNLKVVSHGECWGLERSQFEQFSAVYEHIRSWNESILMINHRGLERSQYKRVCVYLRMYRGLERSQFAPNYTFPEKGLERSSMHGAESLSSSSLWQISPVCKVLGVMFPAIVLKVWVWVLCQCPEVVWRLVKTGVSSCL